MDVRTFERRPREAAFALRAALALVIVAGCGGDTPSVSGNTKTPSGTFDRIQSEILTPNCATGGCHSGTSQFAIASGLVLDRSVAYRNLVNAQVKNAAAKSDGLLRVMPFKPESSLFYHKLVAADGHHSPDYGSMMPLGSEPLYNGYVEYIRRWIAAGAPETGIVVDTSVLLDHTRNTVTPFTTLDAPAQGYQLSLAPFTVAPNFEREFFSYRRVGNSGDVYVNRIEMRMRTNSHHFLLYTLDPGIPSLIVPQQNQIRDIRNSDGSANVINMLAMGYHTFFAGTQTPNYDYHFPDGVALRVAANTSLDLNSHYVNRTNAPLTGEVYANLHTVAANSVQHVARTLNLNNTDITLPPKTRTTLTKNFVVRDSAMHVFMLTSHMHERGERFVIRITGGPRDGEIVYTTSDWAHPEIVTFPQAIVLQPGQGLTSEITWNNTTDRTIRFGLTSTEEMGIIFGYYYLQ
ncbi:MAG: hypothetical protein ABIT38_08370 [Gemmatimonadaceae bacterium]